jgi:hypothetical protein
MVCDDQSIGYYLSLFFAQAAEMPNTQQIRVSEDNVNPGPAADQPLHAFNQNENVTAA